MIYDLDRPCLATHAVLEDEAIVDRSLNRRIELNSTGMMMLKKMNGQKTVREIAEEIAEHYRVDSEHVVRDLLALCGQLLMSDVIYLKRYSDWRTRFLTQDFSGMLRRLFLPRRQDIESANLAGILWEIGGVVLRSWWFLLLFFGMTGVFLSQVTGDKRFFLGVFGFALLFVLGYCLHEGMHVFMLRKSVGNPFLGYVRVTFWHVRIVRPDISPRVNFLVAVSGPLLPTSLGVGLYGLHLFFPQPLIVFSAFMLSLHIFSLIPFPTSFNAWKQAGGSAN